MSRTTQLGMFALIGFAMAWRGVGVASAQVWDVPQKYQEMDYWCWAACMESILTYYAHPHTQTEIAQYGTGGVNTWTYSYGSGTEGGIFRRGCDQILDYFANIHTIPLSSASSRRCDWLLIHGEPRNERKLSAAGWQQAWEGKRPGDRHRR